MSVELLLLLLMLEDGWKNLLFFRFDLLWEVFIIIIYKSQEWVIRRRHIIRCIVFITYLTVFFKLLRRIQFWALNEFCSHKPPRAPQKHSQAL